MKVIYFKWLFRVKVLFNIGNFMIIFCYLGLLFVVIMLGERMKNLYEFLR